MAARKPHREAHPECVHKSWAACDTATKVAFGQCKAMTGDKVPAPCSHWAASESGYCSMHHASEVERVRREERVNAKKAELDGRISAFLGWTSEHPSVWDRPPRS